MYTRFIAEIGSNHNGSLVRALHLIDAAKECGFDAVKFQLYDVDKLFTPEVLRKLPDLAGREHNRMRSEWLETIGNRTRELGLQLIVSPLYLEAVDELEPYVDIYKIASYELNWSELLARLNGKTQPVYLSTGAATWDEVCSRIHFTANLAGVFHCVSRYPIEPHRCQLVGISKLQWLRGGRSWSVGWSDHSADADVVKHAVMSYGADMVEMHFDLDAHGAEFSGGHCWLPAAAAEIIDYCNPEAVERQWRRDTDGLRPMRAIR